ncbi:Uncharacterized conserved protein, DUF885 familyt [Sphingomonas sp. OV641]|uniref:DUF885 domain-containing protein n=1 Tax=Sphingomonas sp. OV641 TaxID=1881068 RepID=UPI0008C3A187|nr:DUF885 domain-containing protein [Sphingomonas sp. OV641]SEJ89736.1 Uncharacterized conserved protein, DUF885 familyt [Sphingomonas sp. OV641]
MIDRRRFLEGTAASLAFGHAVPALGQGGGSADAALAALLQRHSEAYLRRSPEEATGNDYDVGANAALRARLDDRSLAARASDQAAIRGAITQLGAIDVAALSPRGALDHAVARFVYETLSDLLGRYGYVDGNLRPSPYVVSQMNGAYYWLPDFIGSRHPIETRADVEAWLLRLAALATALDQETDRIRHDAGLGVIPPDFVIQRTMVQIKGLRDGEPLQSALIAPALKRIREKSLGDVEAQALGIFRTRIQPALTRQAEVLEALLPRTDARAGVWKLPDGDAYYAAAVRSNTTVDTSPAELHRIGLEQCRALTAQIDTLLKAQGMSGGSVIARIAALDADPRFIVSNDDAGRAKLLGLANDHLKAITARLPAAFNKPAVDPIVVRRIPPAIEAGAPGAFYSEGAPGQPGVYSINLHRPDEHVLWRLPTLTHHEGIPGHHFQYSMLRRAPALPLFRRIVRFSSYTEGWALYAQQVADELGAFEDDAFGRIGYLQSELFRAARIVVDTGLHHHRWTKQQAVAWMVENAGEQQEATDREVTRYAVYPGQACSFKVGANAIHAAREKARTAMGDRFDVRDYHDLVLSSGPMPMSVLQSATEAWSGKAAS